MPAAKYIFDKGVMKLNPAYSAEHKSEITTVAKPSQSLAIISSMNDVSAASAAQQAATQKPLQLSESTTASMEIMQDASYLKKFKSSIPVDGGELIDGLTAYFAKYEVPLGLINKLLALTEYNLNFVLDDSGSMNEASDVHLSESSPHIQKRYNDYKIGDTRRITRWNEMEDRLHTIIDMLSYLPTNPIMVSFLNRTNKLDLNRNNETREQFVTKAHATIKENFDKAPAGMTPLYSKLKTAFSTATGNTMHYVFTDGEPSDATIETMKNLVLTRNNPQQNPLTFISCTDSADNANWMKEIEEEAPYVSEVDDFNSERAEVLKDQGPALPYSKGFWLLCQLVSTNNPDDLDALDESNPFTKMTLDNILGRKLLDAEYQLYFQSNPNAEKVKHLYQRFATEQCTVKELLKPAPAGSGAAGMFNLFSVSAAAPAPAPAQQNMQPPAYSAYAKPH